MGCVSSKSEKQSRLNCVGLKRRRSKDRKNAYNTITIKNDNKVETDKVQQQTGESSKIKHYVCQHSGCNNRCDGNCLDSDDARDLLYYFRYLHLRARLDPRRLDPRRLRYRRRLRELDREFDRDHNGLGRDYGFCRICGRFDGDDDGDGGDGIYRYDLYDLYDRNDRSTCEKCGRDSSDIGSGGSSVKDIDILDAVFGRLLR
ncbi:unnamed protein product, partial [Adineta steineri]